MDRPPFDSSVRRYTAYVGVFGTTQLHIRNPWMIAFWSAAFPGVGHLLLSKYVRGFLLFIWEVVVNFEAHINLALLYSFTGRFELAKEVLEVRWVLLYLPTFMFAIWDSYRTAVDINHEYLLAYREDAEIKPFNISAVGINYLEQRKPWVALVWSTLSPGTGQLYLHRLPTATFILIWWIAIVYLSKTLPAIHYSLLGDFEGAKAVVDPQWFLNVPSVMFFSMYDAYVNTVENNKLFKLEQKKFLKNNYLSTCFNMPNKLNRDRGEKVYIVSTFEHSKHLELAITALQMKGINKENILAVPMDKQAEDRKLFDSIHYSDGKSLLDLPFVLATLFGIFGAIYGFIFKWGPVIWGLLGMIFGIVLGLIIKFATIKNHANKTKKINISEVVLIIDCQKNKSELVKDILWEHLALGVSQLSLEKGN